MENERSNEDELEEIASPIHIITIVLDETNGLPPTVDLGDLSPLVAHTILQTVVDALYDCIPAPRIMYDDLVLMDYDYATGGDDDDDYEDD